MFLTCPHRALSMVSKKKERTACVFSMITLNTDGLLHDVWCNNSEDFLVQVPQYINLSAFDLVHNQKIMHLHWMNTLFFTVLFAMPATTELSQSIGVSGWGLLSLWRIYWMTLSSCIWINNVPDFALVTKIVTNFNKKQMMLIMLLRNIECMPLGIHHKKNTPHVAFSPWSDQMRCIAMDIEDFVGDMIPDGFIWMGSTIIQQLSDFLVLGGMCLFADNGAKCCGEGWINCLDIVKNTVLFHWIQGKWLYGLVLVPQCNFPLWGKIQAVLWFWWILVLYFCNCFFIHPDREKSVLFW